MPLPVPSGEGKMAAFRHGWPGAEAMRIRSQNQKVIRGPENLQIDSNGSPYY
jgi:hypothetical protein